MFFSKNILLDKDAMLELWNIDVPGSIIELLLSVEKFPIRDCVSGVDDVVMSWRWMIIQNQTGL
jgi:hypothetical protein